MAFAKEFSFVCVFDFIHNVSSVFFGYEYIHLRKICFHFLSSEFAKKKKKFFLMVCEVLCKAVNY